MRFVLYSPLATDVITFFWVTISDVTNVVVWVGEVG